MQKEKNYCNSQTPPCKPIGAIKKVLDGSHLHAQHTEHENAAIESKAGEKIPDKAESKLLLLLSRARTAPAVPVGAKQNLLAAHTDEQVCPHCLGESIPLEHCRGSVPLAATTRVCVVFPCPHASRHYPDIHF